MTEHLDIVDRTYLLGEKLGQGGMGTVHRAIHRMSGRIVALKLLRHGDAGPLQGQSASDLHPRLALAREFQILSSLHHPNIVQVIDYGFDEAKGPYVAMELLSPSQTILEAGANRSTREKVQLLAQLFLALAYLHHRQIVHRDLKPSNVLFSNDAVKVLDFGLATSVSQRADLAGTLDYVAPELWFGATPSVQSDLYACGVIACQLLTGRIPDWEQRGLVNELSSSATTTHWSSDETISSLLKLLKERRESANRSGGSNGGVGDRAPAIAPAATINGPLGQVVRRLLEPEPQERYTSAVNVLGELSNALGEPLPIETAATRESFLQASVMIGRDQELGSLRSALKATIAGAGASWLVGGESGVGKSRLFSELRTEALVEGAVVVQGQAIAEGGSSYHLWLPVLSALCMRIDLPEFDASVLKGLVPDLPMLFGRAVPDPPPLPPVAAQSRLLQTIESLFRRQVRPTLVLLEDLQWADVDSRNLLGRLNGLTSDIPTLILANYRDDEAPTLPETLPEMRLMRLSRLDKDHCAALSTSMLGVSTVSRELVDYLYRETEGNVFFLVEIVRELAQSAGQLDRISATALPAHVLTGGIDRIAQRRFSLISAEDRELMALSAIAGRELDLELLHQALPTTDLSSWLLACTSAVLIEMQRGKWRFVHDKLREAILSRIAREEVPGLHRRIAQATESLYDGATLDARSAVLAYHFEQAHEMRKAWIFHMRAGDRATRLCAYGEARLNYSGALRVVNALEETDETRRHKIDTLLKQVYARLLADTGDENFKAMTEAKELLDHIASRSALGAGDQLRLARVNHAFGRIHFYRGDIQTAIEHFKQVLPLAQQTGDEELMALPSFLIGTALMAQGNVRAAEPLLAQAIGPVERLGEPFEWFRAVGYHGATLIGLGRYREGLAELDRVLERAERIGQPSLLAASHLMRGSSFLLSGDWPLVIQHLEQTVALAQQTGEMLLLTMGWSGIGWARSFLGDHMEAEASRDKGREAAKKIGGGFLLSDWYEAGDAEMALEAGRSDQALARAEAVTPRSAAAGLLFSQGIAERVWGSVLAEHGDVSGADAHMQASVAALERGGMVLQAARTRVRWALDQRRRGDSDAAAQLFEQARRQFEKAGCTYALNEAVHRWADAHLGA